MTDDRVNPQEAGGRESHGHVAADGDRRTTPDPGWLVEQYVVLLRSAQDLAEETGWSSQFIRDRLREAGCALRPAGPVKATPLTVETLQDQLARGLSVAEIARRWGYAPAGVYKLIRLHHLRLPSQGRPAPEVALQVAEHEAVAECGRRYAAGESLTVIGAAFGHGPDWARARVVAAGQKVRAAIRYRPRDPAAPEPPTVAELRVAVAAGMTVAELADRFERSKDVVRGWLRETDIDWPRPRPRSRATAHDLPDPIVLQRLYVDQGLSIAGVATHLGTSVHRVRAGLQASGIPRRDRNATLDGTPPEPIPLDRLRELYVDRGLSAAEVARDLGTSQTRVIWALRRNGIPVDPTRRRPPPPPLDVDAATLRAYYVQLRLTDEEIGRRLGVPADRVRRRRRELQVRRDLVPPPPPPPSPASPGRDRLVELYETQGLTLAQIARQHHTSLPKVRTWLQQADIPIRARTARTHRRGFDVDLLRALYVDREWSAATIAAELDTTIHQVLRSLHDHQIPVRHKTTRQPDCHNLTRPAGQDHDARHLVRALYDDPEVIALLARHVVPTRPEGGTIAERFPTPIATSHRFLREAYVIVGLTARHIELLTGQPAGQILDTLHTTDIPVRGSGLSPWLSRQLGR